MLAVLAIAQPQLAIAEIHNVLVQRNSFSPSVLNIKSGDTVIWQSASDGECGGGPYGGGCPEHVVKADDFSFSSGGPSADIFFSQVFSDAGEILYHCEVHSEPGKDINSFMNGRITVQAAVGAELDLQSVDATDGTYASADMLTIDTTIMNSGTAGSGMFSIDYYASPDNVISEDDILLASENIGDIAMGATLNHQAMVGVSAIVVAGDYFIGAIITFTDGNTADNSNVDATAVTFLGLFFINAGLNDAWVHDGAPLQGFMFTVFPATGFLFFAWFTFDSVPPGPGVPPAVFGANDQSWVSGLGQILGDSVTISVELTSGGVFNASEPEATQEKNYGTRT